MPLFLLFATPNFIMVLWYTVKHHDGSFAEFAKAFLASSSPMQFVIDMWSRTNIATPFSVYVISGYMLFQVILMKLVPGPRAEGPITPNGNIPVYVDNGFRIFLITMATFAGLTYYLKTYTPYSPSLVYDNFGDLLATMNAFSMLFCVGLYFKGLLAPSTTDSGTSGNPLFDYYWGTELYPRIFGIDVKVSSLSESRPLCGAFDHIIKLSSIIKYYCVQLSRLGGAEALMTSLSIVHSYQYMMQLSP